MTGQGVMIVVLVALVIGAYVLGRIDGSVRRDVAHRDGRTAEGADLHRLRVENDGLRERLEQAAWRGITADQSVGAARARVDDLQSEVWAARKRLAGAVIAQGHLAALESGVREVAAEHDRDAEQLEAQAEPFAHGSIERVRGQALAHEARERAQRLRDVLRDALRNASAASDGTAGSGGSAGSDGPAEGGVAGGSAAAVEGDVAATSEPSEAQVIAGPTPERGATNAEPTPQV